MTSHYLRAAFGLTAVALCACLATTALAQKTAGNWTASQTDNGNRYLDFQATQPLLGKATRFNLVFQCNPVSTKDVQGTLGFDLYLHKIKALAPFSFDDFEGPDATVGQDGKRPMEITVTRKDAKPLVLKLVPNGFTPSTGNFAFGFADLSKSAKSDARTLLTALTQPDAETLRIVITDPRNPKLKLDFLVPVAGRQAEFKTLLTGLK